MEIVTLNEKGQVTIPARVRRNGGLKKGVQVAPTFVCGHAKLNLWEIFRFTTTI